MQDTNSCNLGLKESEIPHVFGSEDTIKTCEKCDNMLYDNGIMTCKFAFCNWTVNRKG